MKITWTVEASPEEVREVLGLPNMGKMQTIVMEKIGEKVATGDMDVGSMMDILVPKLLQAIGKKFMETAVDSVGKSGKSKKAEK